ncbi:hypothetical protein MAPG_02252 [Magnaporthiopsis poae ATCC 64411]|uniref:Uncharacterized protein n=1 Tax=Magnaporthiopsis poae (strain ATCC 64411 / 73-15) TaxID=644358 RepID=A0A0C4DQV5_MAGP6|nr:hypothetical protein MAPG_02252 [Magnaporthiopsis poae ATCC 64411]
MALDMRTAVLPPLSNPLGAEPAAAAAAPASRPEDSAPIGCTYGSAPASPTALVLLSPDDEDECEILAAIGTFRDPGVEDLMERMAAFLSFKSQIPHYAAARKFPSEQGLQTPSPERGGEPGNKDVRNLESSWEKVQHLAEMPEKDLFPAKIVTNLDSRMDRPKIEPATRWAVERFVLYQTELQGLGTQKSVELFQRGGSGRYKVHSFTWEKGVCIPETEEEAKEHAAILCINHLRCVFEELPYYDIFGGEWPERVKREMALEGL